MATGSKEIVEKVDQTTRSDAEDGERWSDVMATRTGSSGKKKGNCKTVIGAGTAVVTKKCPVSSKQYLDRLPSEIIMNILTYLDASSLLNISVVNKRFHNLADSNSLWRVLYDTSATKKNTWWPKKRLLKELPHPTNEPLERPEGYWKKKLMKDRVGYKDTMWKKDLKPLNPQTGMPVLTTQVLQTLHIKWEITLTLKNGEVEVYGHTHTLFEDSSVTLIWSQGNWPYLYRVTGIQLHGTAGSSQTPGGWTGWRSLICKTSVHRKVTKLLLGADRLVELKQFDSGIIIGVWRGSLKMAFVIVNLHFYKLIERSLLGSSSCAYVLPKDGSVDHCGQQQCTIHIVLHNSVQQIMCHDFSSIIRKVKFQKDFFQLTAIDYCDVSEYIPVGKIDFPWKAKGMHGSVQHCCLMTVTILDQIRNPLWCVSSAVKMRRTNRALDLEYEGEQFFIHHMNSQGKVKMTFVWMEEFQQNFLVQLAVSFSSD